MFEFAEAGTPVLRVLANDAECSNSSCITYNLEPAAENDSSFVIDYETGVSYDGLS